jgi:release factor glutamine methyltransferase
MQKEIDWLLKEKYSGKPSGNFQKDVARLKAGEPLDYIIEFCEFLGCKIDLSCRPLIPRPETEYWVSNVVSSLKLKASSKEVKVLDIFSGSGCIGIAILEHIKKAKVTFAEKNKKYIKQIKINLKINKINSKRYKVVQSDVFKNIRGKFDYIFANPPYISQKRIHKIQKSVLNYEPQMALLGGADGLLYIRKFLAEAKNFLNPEGKIYMEFDSIQKNAIEKLLKKYGYNSSQFHKDQYGKARYVVMANKV